MRDATFQQIAGEHRARWPLMEPQDYGKLAYQSEMGPEHAVSDPALALEEILAECRALPPDAPRRLPEAIGNGLCRFHLSPLHLSQEGLLPVLAMLFTATARRHRGTRQGLEARLAELEGLGVPGMGPWLRAYREEGCPPLHHSETFRRAYRPHYRVIAADYVPFLFVLLAVYPLWREGRPAIVAIDGRCGSGKSGLATMLAQVFPCNVFHMDDFYLPAGRRSPERMARPGGDMDVERFRSQVLEPLSRGETVTYRAFDRATRTERPAVEVPFRPLNVVEGSCSCLPALRDAYQLRLFLTCTVEEQRRRLLAREGPERLKAFETRWIPREEAYFAACHVEEESDLTVDTTDLPRTDG